MHLNDVEPALYSGPHFEDLEVVLCEGAPPVAVFANTNQRRLAVEPPPVLEGAADRARSSAVGARVVGEDQLGVGSLDQVVGSASVPPGQQLVQVADLGLVDVEAPESMVTAEMQNQLQNMLRQLQMQGIDPEAWLSATGQDPQQMMEGTRPQAEQAVKADLALRAVAEAEGIEATDDDIEMEYARMAMQFGQKAKDIRRAYEQQDAVPELVAQIRKSKAMDWLLHHVEMVDHDGTSLDTELILGDPDACVPATCAGDVDLDDEVGFADLLVLLAAWGPCDGACPADLDGDLEVGFQDLLILLAAWGGCS